jgi:hypothetical protein
VDLLLFRAADFNLSYAMRHAAINVTQNNDFCISVRRQDTNTTLQTWFMMGLLGFAQGTRLV